MTKDALKHVPVNLFTNIIVFILNIIVNLFMTPFYIAYIGVDGLGVVRLALLLPTYIGLATIIISGAVGRFLTLSLQQNNKTSANEIFNTSLFGISAILFLIFPLIVYIAMHITDILNVPVDYSRQASLLFLGVFIASQITVFSTLFLIPAYANNRLDIQNYIKIITIFIQASAIIVIFSFFSQKIFYIGYAYVSASLIGLFFSFLVWREFAPFLTIHKSFFRLNRLYEITSMGSWVLINQLGSILFLSIDLLIINHYFGAEATGDYSVVLQWSILLRSMAGMVASIFGPIIVINYAQKQFNKIVEYSKFAIKFMGVLIAIPIGLLMGFSDPLFTLWLGPDFTKLTPLLWLMIGHLVVNLTVLPLFSINTAYNKVKLPALVSLCFGCINILLAILLVTFTDLEVYGVALAGAIVLMAKNTLFTPVYAAYVLDIHWFTFIKEMRFALIVFGITMVFSYFLNSLINITQWMDLILCWGLVFVLIGTIVWIGILSKMEKNIIIAKLNKKRNID